MLFTDDESRHKFHQSATFLQMICTMLENDMSKHHIQLELINTDYEEETKITRAYIIVADHDFRESPDKRNAFRDVTDALGKRFKGKIMVDSYRDGFVTVQLKEDELSDPLQLN